MGNANDTATHIEDTTLEKATLWYRIGAFLVDHTIIAVVLTVLFMPFFPGDTVADYNGWLATFSIFMLAGVIVYGLKDVVRGQSFGKYILGLAVRDSDNASEVPSIPRLFMRNIFTFVWPVEFIILACSSSKTKLGDRLAGTNVYRISKKPKPIVVIIPIFLAIAIFVGSIMLMLRNHPSYHTALDFIETNPRIIELVGDVEGFGFFPNGSVSTTNGYGIADFTIRVNGSDGTVHVRIIVVREPLGDWEVVSFGYRQ
ncbi:MAG: RDD family protein [Defluviitaleaceae bacterium]|nr:RDD family protein [Defluviitaleaceae bacterium]